MSKAVLFYIIMHLNYIFLPVYSMAQSGHDGEHILYVDTKNGSDTYSGDKKHPLKTVTHAQTLARDLKNRPVQIVLREGVYSLDKPWMFESADSRTEENRLLIRSFDGEKAVISGGRILHGWTSQGNLVYKELGQNVYPITCLYGDDGPRQRARHPNTGALNKAACHETDNRSKFYFKPGDVQQYEQLTDVNVLIAQHWMYSVHWLTAVDLGSNLLSFRDPAWKECGTGIVPATGRYIIENAFEVLDEPGEWYLNRSSGRLYYYPMPDETIDDLQLIAPKMHILLGIKGSSASSVEHIHFEGISFKYTDWQVDEYEQGMGQAHKGIDCGIFWAEYAKNCIIKDCEFSYGGGQGINLSIGCQNNTIEKCHIHHLGGGGVYIGETRATMGACTNPPASDRVEYNTVENCFIHDLSLFWYGCTGVWIGAAAYNTVQHCDISNNSYSGISVGWCWSNYKGYAAHHNIVEYNHIHHLFAGVLQDGGGIYTLGQQPGTIVRGNIIHHIYGYKKDKAIGLYPDQASEGILFEKNIIYNVTGPGVYSHKAINNTIRNNVFAYCGGSHFPSGIWWASAGGDIHAFTFEQNIILQKRHPDVILYGWGKRGTETWQNNVYWDIDHKDDLRFLENSFSDWQKAGNDIHSLMKDPRFVVAVPQKAEDFRLGRNSPALQFGFEELDQSKVGTYDWDTVPHIEYYESYTAIFK